MTWTILLAAALTGQQAWPAHAREPVRPRPVAVVNGTALLSDRLEAVVRTLLPLESFHQGVRPEAVAAVRRRALDRIVDEELLYQDGVKRGIAVTAAEVETRVADLMKAYKNRREFDAAMAKAGATPDGVRAEIRRQLVIAKSMERRVSGSCAVGADEARRYFDQHPERFVEPERLHIHAITFTTDPSGGQAARAAGRARAEEKSRQLQAGAPFDGTDMGVMHRGSLTPEFEAAAKDLRPGEVSAVIESLYGYHIIRLTRVLPARRRAFADVAPRLQDELSAARCDAAKASWLAALRAAAAIVYPQ